MIFLWLNYGHYDLILSPYTFSRCNAARYCFQCMCYFRRGETKYFHVCKTAYSCQRCYSTSGGCNKEPDFIQECNTCHVLFNNRLCFTNNLTKKIFKNTYCKIETACEHMFFCKTCYKTVPCMIKLT